MKPQRALIVEDHPQVASILRPLLQSCSLNVDYAIRCDDALRFLQTQNYALVVLDRNLPDGDGLDVLKAMREQNLHCRVIILSERGRVEERIRGLNRGADDYLPKPFASEEFRARVQALLRREKRPMSPELEFGPCLLAIGEQQLVYGPDRIQLSKHEAQLFELLIRHPRHTATRDRIATSLWSSEHYPTDASIDSFMKRVRRKLTNTPVRLRTRYNLGYELYLQD
ncbi:MAG TPA: response regulator transcription factor [Candidatus Saccharimonadia bacterium]|nr:response regulator transcription factor [Candidatus Saccharimonadia bacterium]